MGLEGKRPFLSLRALNQLCIRQRRGPMERYRKPNYSLSLVDEGPLATADGCLGQETVRRGGSTCTGRRVAGNCALPCWWAGPPAQVNNCSWAASLLAGQGVSTCLLGLLVRCETTLCQNDPHLMNSQVLNILWWLLEHKCCKHKWFTLGAKTVH